MEIVYFMMAKMVLTTAYGNVIALDTILNTCFNSDKASYDEKINRSCLSVNVVP